MPHLVGDRSLALLRHRLRRGRSLLRDVEELRGIDAQEIADHEDHDAADAEPAHPQPAHAAAVLHVAAALVVEFHGAFLLGRLTAPGGVSCTGHPDPWRIKRRARTAASPSKGPFPP